MRQRTRIWLAFVPLRGRLRRRRCRAVLGGHRRDHDLADRPQATTTTSTSVGTTASTSVGTTATTSVGTTASTSVGTTATTSVGTTATTSVTTTATTSTTEAEPLAAQSLETVDGILYINVPAGGPVVEVRPAELDITDPAALLHAYELLPDGATFDEPVTLTFSLPSLDDGALTLIGLFSSDGFVEIPRQQSRVADGRHLVTASIDHFSKVAAVDAGARLRMEPTTSTISVGRSVTVELIRDWEALTTTVLFDDSGHTEWSHADRLALTNAGFNGATFTCEAEGEGLPVEAAWTLTFTEDRTLPLDLLTLALVLADHPDSLRDIGQVTWTRGSFDRCSVTRLDLRRARMRRRVWRIPTGMGDEA